MKIQSSQKAFVDDNAKNNTTNSFPVSGISGIIKVLAGNGSYVALGFLANLVSANGLSPAGFGLVSLGLAMLNVLQEVCGTGIDMAMVRLAAPHIKSSPTKARQFYKASLQIKLLINGFVALTLWAGSSWFATVIYQNQEITPYLHLVSFGLIGASLYNYMLAKFQTEERFTLYAIFRVVNNVNKLLLLGAIWWLSVFHPDNVMAVWIASFFISFGIALMFNQQRAIASDTLFSVDLAYWREIIDFGKWVVASSFLFSLYSRIDLLILGCYSNAEELGQYAVAWNITFVIDLLTYSIIIALLPKAARMTKSCEFSNYIKSTFLICLTLVVALLPIYFLSDWAFTVFFPQYVDASEVFYILFWGAIVTLLFHPVYLILYARNRVSRLALINFSLVAFCATFGVIFIPEYGTLGAAKVIVAGRVFAAILICYFVYLELRSTQNDEAASS